MQKNLKELIEMFQSLDKFKKILVITALFITLLLTILYYKQIILVSILCSIIIYHHQKFSNNKLNDKRIFLTELQFQELGHSFEENKEIKWDYLNSTTQFINPECNTLTLTFICLPLKKEYDLNLIRSLAVLKFQEWFKNNHLSLSYSRTYGCISSVYELKYEGIKYISIQVVLSSDESTINTIRKENKELNIYKGELYDEDF